MKMLLKYCPLNKDNAQTED